MSIEIRNVNKRFGDFQALRDVNLHIASGELLALLALVTLVIKSVAEWKSEQEMKAAAALPPERPAPAPGAPR